MKYRQTLLAFAGLSVSILPAAAQDTVDAGDFLPEDWSYEALYESGAWSVDQFFGKDVTGINGEQIGDVEDVVLNNAGEVVALIAEVGGFWDIGDTHVSVPWDRVQLGDDGSVTVPVTQDNIAEFDLFATSGLPENANVAEEIVEGVDDAELGSRLWRASEMINDYVRVQTEDETWQNFGYVSDLMINDGTIVATLVSTTSSYGPGSYAYPYPRGSVEGHGVWRRDSQSYDLPILEGDATSLPVFDKGRLQ